MTAHNSEFCSIQFANSKTTETHDTPKLNYLRNLKKKTTLGSTIPCHGKSTHLSNKKYMGDIGQPFMVRCQAYSPSVIKSIQGIYNTPLIVRSVIKCQGSITLPYGDHELCAPH